MYKYTITGSAKSNSIFWNYLYDFISWLNSIRLQDEIIKLDLVIIHIYENINFLIIPGATTVCSNVQNEICWQYQEKSWIMSPKKRGPFWDLILSKIRYFWKNKLLKLLPDPTYNQIISFCNLSLVKKWISKLQFDMGDTVVPS